MASSPDSPDEPQSPPASRRRPPSPQGMFREPQASPAVSLPQQSHPLDDDDLDYGNDSGSDEATPPPSSSTLSVSDKKMLAAVVGEGVEIIGWGLHGLVANDLEKDFELYLVDEQDKTGISKPVAGLLGRRGVMDGSPDVLDLLALFVAIAAYLKKQLERRRAARQYAQAEPTAPLEPAA